MLLGNAAARWAAAGGDQLLDSLVLVLLVIGEKGGIERLGELGAVAVERVGLQRQPPAESM